MPQGRTHPLGFVTLQLGNGSLPHNPYQAKRSFTCEHVALCETAFYTF